VPNSIFFGAGVPKVSAYLRHCGRFLEKRAGDFGSIALRDRLGSENRAVSSNRTPSASVVSQMALSRDLAAKEREQFAASRRGSLYFDRGLAPQMHSLEGRLLCTSVLSLGDTVSKRCLKWVF
jgi:hypothetical protein